MKDSWCDLHRIAKQTIRADGDDMSDGHHFRKWAAQVARQAGEEPDAGEAQRLLTIAEYWVRLADSEDWTQNQPVAEPHQSQ
jgi:hypothetical protein